MICTLEMDIDELKQYLHDIARAWCNEQATGSSEDWTPANIFEEMMLMHKAHEAQAWD